MRRVVVQRLARLSSCHTHASAPACAAAQAKRAMAGQAQHTYRDLLRTVRKHAKGDHFSDFICQKFRDSVASKDVEALQKNVALAKDYAYLVKSVHAHKDLLISYNIGVDREVEQAARLKDTANRVGLSMPKLFEEESK